MKTMPEQIHFSTIHAVPHSKIFLWGDKKPLKWEISGDGMTVFIPRSLQKNPSCKYVWTLTWKTENR